MLHGKKKYVLIVLIAVISIGSFHLVAAVEDSNIYKNLQMFNQVFNMVKMRYVDEVDSDTLIKGAIEGMLLDLDPHSNFLDVEEYEDMRTDHEGEFFGLGIQISVPNGILTVISPIEGTPAYEMGLQAGDIISHIEGESTEGITSDEAVKKLRGPKDTQVTITVIREGEEEPFDLTITRDRIPIYSVPYHFMIRPGIGYVRMTRFSKNTTDELTAALDDLKKDGMQSLILDLRSNPGGFLNQAVQVSDLFLPSDKMVVSTKGRIPNSSEEYKTRWDNQYEGFPVVAVVNQGSASASEIVAGAIQDWDRGLVIGERTFGKGLVQRVYELPPDNKKALKLTIAKYYTPSGRLIQREYHKDRRDYYMERGTETGDTTDVKFTSKGREVTGGGGILPDIIVEQDTLPPIMVQLMRKREFFNFAIKYNNDHDFSEGWDTDKETIALFKEFLKDNEFEYEDDEFTENLERIKLGIKREIYNTNVNTQAGVQVAIETDKQIMHAVRVLEGTEVVDNELKAILKMN